MPARNPKNAADHQHKANHQRERAGQRDIVGRAGGGEQSQAASENRRDRGVGAARQEAVAAQQGKTQ
jgi:hypothetical protein